MIGAVAALVPGRSGKGAAEVNGASATATSIKRVGKGAILERWVPITIEGSKKTRW